MEISADFAAKEQKSAKKYTRPLISFNCLHCGKLFNLGSFFWSAFIKLNLPETDRHVQSVLDSFIEDLNKGDDEQIAKLFPERTVNKLRQQLCFCDETNKINKPSKTTAQKAEEGKIDEGTPMVIVGEDAEFEGLYMGRGYFNGFIRLEQVIVSQGNSTKEAAWVVIRENNIRYMYPLGENFSPKVKITPIKPKLQDETILSSEEKTAQIKTPSQAKKKLAPDQADLYETMLKIRDDGGNWSKVAKHLNGKKILTPSGKSIWYSDIARHTFARLNKAAFLDLKKEIES